MELEELKTLASKATPGEWDFDTAETPIRVAGGEVVGGDALPYGDVYTVAEYETPEGPESLIVCTEIGVANGHFIAAANPARILALIAQVEALKDAESRHQDDLDKFVALVAVKNAEIDVLTQERDDARLAAKMHLRTVECATACLHPIVGQALGPHYDAPSESFGPDSIANDGRFLLLFAGMIDAAEFNDERFMIPRQALIDYIDARQPAIAPAATPAGWVLVPEQMSEEMHAAAVRTILRCTGNDDFPPRVYAAMLAAAPTPPASHSSDQ